MPSENFDNDFQQEEDVGVRNDGLDDEGSMDLSSLAGDLDHVGETEEWEEESASGGSKFILPKEFFLLNFLGYCIISMGARFFPIIFGIVMGGFFITTGIYHYVKTKMFTIPGSTAIGIGMVVLILSILYPEVMLIIGFIGYILFYVFYFLSIFFN